MQKNFSCGTCLVDFVVEIEPQCGNDNEIRENYPESIDWLEKLRDCPVCGEPLIEDSP